MMLNDEQADDLAHTLSSKGWTEIIQPTMQFRGKLMIDALLESRDRRAGEFEKMEDDELRYRVKEIQHWLTILKQAVETHEVNRRRAEQQDTEAKPAAVGHPYGSEPA